MTYSLALVDFDGTLADSMPYWLSLPFNTLRTAKLPQPEGFAEYVRSMPMHEIARDMTEKFPQLAAETPLEVRWGMEMAAHYAHDIPLKPAAAEFLRTLRTAGLRVYILSATHHALLDAAVERLGIAPLVDGVYTEAETGSKRTEAPYAFFREKFGMPYERMLLAEDAPRNLAAASALGVAGIGVYDESMKEYTDEIRAGAAVYLPDFSDLSALEKLLCTEELFPCKTEKSIDFP